MKCAATYHVIFYHRFSADVAKKILQQFKRALSLLEAYGEITICRNALENI